MSAQQHANHGDGKATSVKDGQSDSTSPAAAPSTKQRPRKIATLWAKTGINWKVYKAMFKGALAPTIAISVFQANAFAQHYTTVGYLVGVTSILALVIRPRAVYLENIFLNTIVVCCTTAVLLLALFCCVKARQNDPSATVAFAETSGVAASGIHTAGYNSSASAVAGVWLFVLVYVLSAIRSLNPKYLIPCICGCIVANVGMVYGPQFATMAQAQAFAAKLLEAILTGFGISFAVSLFIFPSTSRQVIMADITAYLASLRSSLGVNMAYLHSLEETDMFVMQRTDTARHRPDRSNEAKAVKKAMQDLSAKNAKMFADLPFAKREIVIGNLSADDLQPLGRLLRMIMLPTIGLSSLSEIFERIAEQRGWDHLSTGQSDIHLKKTESEKQAVNEWHALMTMLREPFQDIANVSDMGLEHAMLMLRLGPSDNRARSDRDMEAEGADVRPGSPKFAAFLAKRVTDFHKRKQQILRDWCRMHGMDVPDDLFNEPRTADFRDPQFLKLDLDSSSRGRTRRQLYLLLYMEYLLWSIGCRTCDLVRFVDELKASGKLDRRRLIVPGAKRRKKWLMSLFRPDSNSHEENRMQGNDEMTTISLGEAYSKRKDPTHLPPQNAWERFGDKIRTIAHFFASPASLFGFRVAVATMCIAVVAYLKGTQVFYTQQRLFWAQIMVSIGMQPSAGQSLRTTFFRILGTAIFMIVSWIAWYIVDGKVPGVLVMYFVLLHLGPWIILNYPAYTTLGIIGPITMTLILGYELQVLKIGIQTAESNGQQYYPVYELGPIRLATVLGGLTLGWFWTIFPYPVSEHNEQRKTLGQTFYLLANYYSVLHETVRAHLRGLDDDPTIKGTVSNRLEKARRGIFAKCTMLIAGLRTRNAFIKFDIPIGGKFPRKHYEEITELLQSILNFMALVSYASTSFQDMNEHKDERESTSEWLKTFRKLIGETQVTSQSVTTLLALMSSSITDGQPLPPYLRVPEPYQLSQRLDELDTDLLSVRHIAEPGYASFAVIQIGTKCIIDDLRKLLAAVKELVGELDFSFHAVSTSDPSRQQSDETLSYKSA